MKKYILSLGIALAACGPLVAQNHLKLGHIDRQALMLMLPERKDAEKKMQDFATTLDNRLKAMGAEYEAKVKDAQGRAATMTQTEQASVMRELQELEERIGNAQEQAKADLAKQEEELLAPMVKRTNDAIKAVADEHTFNYVFDSSTGMVLYFDRGEDLMPLVKAKLNIP